VSVSKERSVEIRQEKRELAEKRKKEKKEKKSALAEGKLA
jgi:hypothetical protein